MSKQKYRISKRRSNFSIISNEVAQGLNYCLDALGLYIYLFSLPHEWEFHKNHLRKVCNLGENKLNKLLNILAQHGLVKIAQNRDAQGKFAHFDMEVNDSESFIINKIGESCATVPPKSPYGKNRATVNTSYKEDINKEDIKEKKDKSLCATDVARSRFNDFWSAYPRKKDKKRAQSIWEKMKLDDKADLIIEDVKERLRNESTWKEESYIPHPSTYLKFERWTDEVTLVAIKKNEKFNPAQHTINQLKENPELAKEAAKWF